MGYRRRRIKRVTMGKEPIKHSTTLVSTIGNGSNAGAFELVTTTAGDRSLDGSPQVIQTEASTGNKVMVGDIVKYVNVILQAAVTEAGNDGNTQIQGWLEWGVTWRDEVTVNVPSTNLGTRTLGDILTAMFRGDCLMTGEFPVSVNLPNVSRIQIKLPKKAIKFKLGCELVLHTHFRSANVTDLETDTVRLIQSELFKAYN